MAIFEAVKKYQFVSHFEHESEGRVPEAGQRYTDAADARAYIEASRSGSVGLLEALFARQILWRYRKSGPIRILDVGTGPGWIPTRLSKDRPDWTVTAVDASDVMLQHAGMFSASRKAAVNWRQGWAEHLPFPSQTFDLVVSHFAFHEFADPVAALAETKRVLASNGTLIVQDLLRPGPFMSAFSRAYALTYGARMKRQYRDSLRAAYTAKEIRLMAERAGFRFVNVRSVLGTFLQLTASIR